MFKKEMQLVVFRLGTEEYAVDIYQVQEINRLLNITRVPRAPDFVEGVINLRGTVIPVLNLHRRLGLSLRAATDQTRIVILKAGDILAGVIVDEVNEVIRIGEDQVEEASNLTSAAETNLIMGVGKLGERLIILLNVEKILNLS